MTDTMHFRTAFSGFNREDVVKYIEYVNARHSAEINQLNSEIEYLKSRVAPPDASAEAKLAAALKENEALQQELAQLRERIEELETAPAPAVRSVQVSSSTEQELEAYRRAERTERLARERAEQVYHMTNSALAEATVKVDAATARIGEITDTVLAQLNQLQTAVSGSKQALTEAVEIMYAIRPNAE